MASASDDNHGLDQVVINPGGGDDDSHGIRIVLNQGTDDANFYLYDEDYEYYADATEAGSDQLYYQGTYQYCCGGVGPVLNIGGHPFGESGAADYDDYDSWTTLQIVDTSGSAALGDATTVGSGTGNGSAHLRYTADWNGLSYVMDRTVSYTYPNNYYTDTYSFTIPAGNTDVVKFYNGGDTAPGSSDVGYGVMVTDPVRSVISLNPDSHIMVGQREVAGSRPFDAAVSEHYSRPYDAIGAGDDLSDPEDPAVPFYVQQDVDSNGDPETHDAGFQTQWTLGSTPGVQTYSLETFVDTQAANLDASFGSATGTTGTPTSLDLNIVNTNLVASPGVGYTFTLPAGLVVAAGTPANACGGTLTAAPGSSTITLAGGSVAALGNCLVSVPVTASSGGSYAIGSGSVSGLTGDLRNAVGSSALTVSGPVSPPQQTTGTPTGVTATADRSAVRVTWAAPTSGPAPVRYRVTLSPGGGTCETTQLSCVIGGTAGTVYTASVVAIGADETAGTAATASTTQVGAPVVPSTPPAADSRFQLTTDQGRITSAQTGQQIVVIGDGFLPNSTVSIIIYSTPVVLASPVTDANGSFRQSVTIPASLAAGQHTLVASGVDVNGDPRSLTLQVQVASATSAPTGDLAYTGTSTEVVPTALVGGAVLLLGAGLVLVGRRRRTSVGAATEI